MKKKKYCLKNGEATIRGLVDGSHIGEASGDEVRVLLGLLSLGSATAEELMGPTGLDKESIESALSFWRGAGVLSLAAEPEGKAAASDLPVPPAEKKPKKKKELTERNAEELAASIGKHELTSLIEAAEAQRGEVFNTSDLSILVGLYEELGLDSAYILTLLSYCDGEHGDKKPLRYAERVAFRLFELGIDTYEALEEYIEKQTRLRSREGKLRRMFGIGERKLSLKEERAFTAWCCEYGYDEEIIGAAYDVTVNATGGAEVNYVGKILAHWHECGVTTLEEAEALLQKEREERGRKPKKGTKKAEAKKDELHSSFEGGEFFKRALARSYKNDGE